MLPASGPIKALLATSNHYSQSTTNAQVAAKDAADDNQLSDWDEDEDNEDEYGTKGTSIGSKPAGGSMFTSKKNSCSE